MTAPAIMTDHPTDETLASFADHRLDPKEREAVIKHVANCGECFSVVETAWDFKAGETSVRRFTPRLPTTLMAIAAAIALALLALPAVREWIAPPRMGEVIDGYKQFSKRPIESRLSGGFPHKEFTTPRGPGDEDSSLDVDDYAELRMEALENELAEANSWKELRDLAAAQLLAGHRDQAAQTLERSLKAAGEEKPELINDLAAAHLERARFNRDPAVAAAALKYAERAWALQKTPESAFNRALAYRTVGREKEEQRAWQDYLALDSSSPWAEEVRRDYLREDL